MALETEPLYTTAECATLWKVDPKTVGRWEKQGRLHATRTLGGHRRYYQREVEALLRGETWEPAGGWPQADPLNAPVASLWQVGTGIAVSKRLRAAGIATVGNLVAEDASSLRMDAGLTAAQVDEVRLALFRKRLTLKGEILGDAA